MLRLTHSVLMDRVLCLVHSIDSIIIVVSGERLIVHKLGETNCVLRILLLLALAFLRWFQILRENSFIINLLRDVSARAFQWGESALAACWRHWRLIRLRSLEEWKRGLARFPTAIGQSILEEIWGALWLNLVSLNYINKYVFISLDQRLTVCFAVGQLLVTVTLNALLKSCQHGRLFTFEFRFLALHTLQDFLVVDVSLLHLHLLSELDILLGLIVHFDAKWAFLKIVHVKEASAGPESLSNLRIIFSE